MRRLVAVLGCVLSFGTWMAGPALAATQANGQVVVVVLGSLGLAELRTGPMPFTHSLIDDSAVGLANTLGAGRASMNRSSATIGAGARVQILVDALDPAMNLGERFEDGTASGAYRRRTGYSAKGHAVVDLGLATLDAGGHGLSYHIVPGLLGEAIREGGGANAVFGNGDTSLGYERPGLFREAVYIAMDAKGRVRYGDVGKSNVARAEAAPFGVVSSPARLVQGYREVRDRAALVVLDFGDIARAERYRPYAVPRVTARQRRTALRRADSFLRALVAQLRTDATLMIVSPVGPDDGGANSLTPIILHGRSIRTGLLWSPVTHRPGLVNATDIAPTVLRALELPPRTEFLGSPMVSEADGAPAQQRLDGLQSVYDRASAESALRSPVTSTFTTFVALVFLGVTALLFGERLSPRVVSLARWLLLAVVSAPLAAYLMWFVRPPNSPHAELVLAFVALVLVIPTVASLREPSSGAAIVRICAATAMFIVVDQIGFGGRLIMSSFYGYSPVDGARYYGMGNETWSILIGALLVATTLLVDARRSLTPFARWALPATFAAAVFLIGFPTLGANIAGVIGATAGVATGYLQLRYRRIGVKQVVLIGLAIVLVVALFTGYDTLRPPTAETHIGRSARLITGENGMTELFLLAQRKMLSNLKVMTRTRYSYVLLLILGVLAVLRHKPIGLFAQTLRRHPGLAAALSGGLVGGFVGMLTEDSGVVIPAMIMLFVGSALTIAMVETKYALQDSAGPLDSA